MFRFTGALEDFLPSWRKGLVLEYPFDNSPNLKHAIETFGVPHPEVDVLLVNRQAAEFIQLLADGDEVEAEARVRRLEGEDWRFVLDCHLGRLAKYLRILGFDTLYSNRAEDDWLAGVSAREGRWLLTMDRGLLMRAQVERGYFVRSAKPRDQLAELARRHDFLPAAQPMTRCLICNSLLEAVEKQAVIERIPPKTRLWCEEYLRCRACDRLYWKGSHYEKMLEFVEKVCLRQKGTVTSPGRWS